MGVTPDYPLTADAISKVLGLSTGQPRLPYVLIPDGSKRAFVFNDSLNKYEPLPYVPIESIVVSSLASFEALVKNRMAAATPDANAYALFTKDGAWFVPHKGGLDTYRYARQLSTPWLAVKNALGKTMDHTAFLRFLHSISSWVEDYQRVTSSFKRVVFSQNATVSSAPLIDTEGAAKIEYALEMNARDGKSMARLPGEIGLQLPYGHGQEAETLTLELDIALSQQNSAGKPQLVFTIFAPTAPKFEAAALQLEADAFRIEVGDTLLVLEDF